VTPFLPIIPANDPRRLENTQLCYGNKMDAEILWVKVSKTTTYNIKARNFVIMLYLNFIPL
jgi:hypothetical protein